MREIDLDRCRKQIAVSKDELSGGFVEFKLRNQLHPLLVKEIENATEIWASGRNLRGILTNYSTHLIKAAQKGRRLRFLTANLEDKALLDVLSRPSFVDSDQDSVKHSGGISAKVLKEISNVGDSDNVQIKKASHFPFYAQIIFNPDAETSRMIIEFYGHKIATADRYHFEITKQSHPELYAYYLDQFEKQWPKQENSE
jgi:hypothetical protein